MCLSCLCILSWCIRICVFIVFVFVFGIRPFRPSRSPVVSLLKPNQHIVYVMSLYFVMVYLLWICCVFVFGIMPSRSPVVSLLSPNWLPHAWVSTRTGTKVEKFNSLPTNLNLQSENVEAYRYFVNSQVLFTNSKTSTKHQQSTTHLTGNNFPKTKNFQELSALWFGVSSW